MAETQQFINGDDGLAVRNMLNSVLKYSATYSYNIYDKCFYLGKLYTSLVNNNLNHTPANDAYWSDVKLDAPAATITAPSTSDLIPIIQAGVVNDVALSDILALATLGPNILNNPGFETGTTSGWIETLNGGTITVQGTTKHAGNYALYLKQRTSSTPINTLIYQTMSVLPSTSYQASFWYRYDGTNAPRYSLYDATPDHSGYIIPYTNLSATANTWARVVVNFTTSSTASTIWIAVAPKSQTLSADAYFDDFSVNAVISGGGTTVILPEIVTSDNIVAVVDDNLQIFKRGLIVAEEPDLLTTELKAMNGVDDFGQIYKRYFNYTPAVGDAGKTVELTINLLDNDGSTVATALQNIIVKAAPVQPAATKVMIVGDSLTFNDNQTIPNNAYYPNELCRRLTTNAAASAGFPAGNNFTGISFIGNQGMSNHASQSFTGYPGWKISDYLGTTAASLVNAFIVDGTHGLDKKDVGGIWKDTNNKNWYIGKLIGSTQLQIFSAANATAPPASGTLTFVSGLNGLKSAITYTAISDPQPISPFWVGGKLDITAWMTEQGYTGDPDIMYLLCGWNSTRGITDTTKAGWLASSYFTDLKAFAANFNTEFPSAKLVVVGLQSPSINGGLGNDYDTGDRSNYFKILQSVSHMNQAYQELVNTAPYSDYMGYVNLQAQFDSEYSYEKNVTPVNNRNTDYTELIDDSGIHPSTEGYYQVADAIYRDFVNRYC